ncbi:MAG: hypothetical protein IPK68_11170 [Bdellovibrionales bacterium]|nr:hypothetical protein [Bdellovibrionales bacterium]
MRMPHEISNDDLFYIIGDHIGLANTWEIKFCKTTHDQFTTKGFVSPKQRQVLYEIGSGLCFKRALMKRVENQTPPQADDKGGVCETQK